MAKKNKKEDTPAGAPLWMTTYGDMMTLLLCFFVMLVAMSTTEIEKFKAAAASLKGALSVLPFQDRPVPQPIMDRTSKGSKQKNRRRQSSINKIREIIREKGMEDQIKVNMGDEGIHILMGDPALFDSGRAIIKSDYLTLLNTIAELIDIDTESVRVEGHTDSYPISNSEYQDNWSLSIDRSLAVIGHLRTRLSMDPRKLKPVGCGEYHPVATNSTPEGRAKNRRVEIFIDFKE